MDRSISLCSGVLAAVCPWWTGRSQLSTLNSQTPRWFWPLVVVAMAMTFFYSLPRMNHGFWDDEELNVRTTLYGRFKLNKRTGENFDFTAYRNEER